MPKVIAIMRPARYLIDSVKLADSMGFDTIAAPMVDVVDKTDANFQGFVDRVMKCESDYVIFTSVNGVEFTLLKLKEPEEFIEQLNKTQVVAIGPKTKQALLKNGIYACIVPDQYTSEGVVEKLKNIKGAVIDIARSSHGAPELVHELRKKGAIVHETQVYGIICPKDERHTMLMKQAIAGNIDIFVFTSSMMVRNFFILAEEIGIKNELVRIMNEKMVAAIGKPTSETLAEYGVKLSIVPKHYTFEELLMECKRHDC